MRIDVRLAGTPNLSNRKIPSKFHCTSLNTGDDRRFSMCDEQMVCAGHAFNARAAPGKLCLGKSPNWMGGRSVHIALGKHLAPRSVCWQPFLDAELGSLIRWKFLPTKLVAWEEQDFELLTERLVQLEGHLVALACCASPRSHVHGKRRLPRDRLHVELATVDQLLGPEVKDGHGAVIEVAIEGLGRCVGVGSLWGSRRKLLGNC